MKRPSPFQVDHAVVRVHSGPRPKDGRWRWRADKPNGAGGRVHLWSGWATRDEAGEIVRELLSETGDQPTGDLITVRDLVECWVASQEQRSDVSERTGKACREAGTRLVAGELADVRLEVLGRRQLERHRDTELRSGAAGSSVARDLKYLRQAWRWALDSNELPGIRLLPTVKVERIKPVYTRYTPTVEDVVALLEGVSPAVRRGLVLLASTGCRISEVTSLRWSGVPLDASRIRVEGKTGERVVELHSVVAGEVRRWVRLHRDRRVVGVTGQTIRVALAARSEEIGIPRVSPNGLRRHVVDALYRTGQIDAAAALLGHSAATALSIYRQVSAADRSRAVEGATLGAVIQLSKNRLSADLSASAEDSADNHPEWYSQGEPPASMGSPWRGSARAWASRRWPKRAEPGPGLAHLNNRTRIRCAV